MSEFQEEHDKELELLQRVERGEISADEASRLLEEWTDEQHGPGKDAEPEVIVEHPRVGASSPGVHGSDFDSRHAARWVRWWVLPYTIGVIFTVLGAVWLYLGYNGGNISVGFWLAWIPFMLGVAVMALSWRARASHWIHVRVRQQPGRRPSVIAFSIPLPYRLIKWTTRNFGHYFPPQIRGVDLDELMDTIEQSVSSDNPVYIWVNDESDQEQVEIWIGPGLAI
jgi:hypothetical protein